MEIISSKYTKAIIIVIIGILIYSLSGKITKKVMHLFFRDTEIDKNSKKRADTLVVAINNIIRYVVVIIVVLMVLQVLGVNVSSLIAGLGLAGVIIGLAVQDALKDIIMGKNIITEGFFKVGDVIKYNGYTGLVTDIGLKRTQIKDIATNSKVVISNRNIVDTEVLSDYYDAIIQTPYEKSMNEVSKVMDKIVERVKKLEHVTKSECKGIVKFNDSSIDYVVRVYCDPKYRRVNNYLVNAIIKDELDKNKISIPYQQIDIHTDK